MSVASISFQKFLIELDESNIQKSDMAPVVLIIQSKHDVSGIFLAAPARSFIFQIAKIHRVAIKTIEDGREFSQTILKSYLELNKKASYLIIMAHGNSDRIQFGKEASWYQFWRQPFLYNNLLVQEDFIYLTNDAKILLYSCNTGLGIAQSIANVSNKVVYAPIGDLCDIKTCLHNFPCQDLKFVSYNEKNEQHVWEFAPQKTPLQYFSNELNAEENNHSFFNMIEYIKNIASDGDANAQWKIGMVYLTGLGICQKSEEMAVHWLSLAADQGLPQAQFELGIMYLYGKGSLDVSTKKAAEWIFLAANKEYPQASFQMGVFYLNGQCGFEQSDEMAAKCFTLAAKNGIPQALFNLGVLYEHGRGLGRSLSYAKHLYTIAEGLRIPGAKERLTNLTNQSKFQFGI